ncbi:hypothetical protein F4781DRAFT_427399 [Annulohypoxylon bovei var. microspora]|nr:hypothetical protein F4781DRAFT_427399 [Annulohypoxylon bovei var. microspora]
MSPSKKTVFQPAQLNPAEFRANVFALSDVGLQQKEIQNITSISNPSRLIRPRSIGLIIEGVDNYEKKDSLGKNLLDSFALIFARPGAMGVTATAMKWDGKEPREYVLYVAMNFGNDKLFPKLSSDIERWFATTSLYDTKERLQNDHVNNPDSENTLWKSILYNCYPSIRKSLYETCYMKASKIAAKDAYHFRHVRDMILLVSCPKPGDTIPPEAEGLLSVLDHMNDLIHDHLYWKPGDGRSTPLLKSLKPATPKDINHVHEITNICYELLESYKCPVEDLIERCQIQYSLRKFRRLIHIMASYCRACERSM